MAKNKGINRCPYAEHLPCQNMRTRYCPLSNKAFLSALERWALLGRTPPALNPESEAGGGHNPGNQEERLLEKCKIARLFNNSGMILDWIENGGTQIFNMNYDLCAELLHGKDNYIDMTNKEFAETNEDFREACSMVGEKGIDPTTRQASKWRKRRGIAYKTWKMQNPQKKVKSQGRVSDVFVI